MDSFNHHSLEKATKAIVILEYHVHLIDEPSASRIFMWFATHTLCLGTLLLDVHGVSPLPLASSVDVPSIAHS